MSSAAFRFGASHCPIRRRKRDAPKSRGRVCKVDKNEIPVWVESAEAVAGVKTKVKDLFKLDPTAEYVIFSQQTQNKISVRSDTPLDL